MILTITPNPALDMTWRVDALTQGETHRVDACAVRAGGKGINVARVLHSQGHDVVALSTQGGASGADFAADLVASGVPHDLVAVKAPLRRSAAIVDVAANESTVLNEYGGELAPAEVDELISRARALSATADAIAISGSVPAAFRQEDFALLISGARDSGRPVLVDTSGPALLTAARAGASALKPNEEELRAATGCLDIRDGAQQLLDLGAHVVLVSQGERGLRIFHRDGRIVSAVLARVVSGNATGAGDAVSAALLSELAADPKLTDLDAVARKAAAWGAAAVAMPLAGDISSDATAWQADVTITHEEGSA